MVTRSRYKVRQLDRTMIVAAQVKAPHWPLSWRQVGCISESCDRALKNTTDNEGNYCIAWTERLTAAAGAN